MTIHHKNQIINMWLIRITPLDHPGNECRSKGRATDQRRNPCLLSETIFFLYKI